MRERRAPVEQHHDGLPLLLRRRAPPAGVADPLEALGRDVLQEPAQKNSIPMTRLRGSRDGDRIIVDIQADVQHEPRQERRRGDGIQILRLDSFGLEEYVLFHGVCFPF